MFAPGARGSRGAHKPRAKRIYIGARGSRIARRAHVKSLDLNLKARTARFKGLCATLKSNSYSHT